MDVPAKKTPLPFKTMDIKAAFQSKSVQAKKRKASSPQDCKSDSKALKLSNNCVSENETVAINEKTIDSKLINSPLPSAPSDYKENTDLSIERKLCFNGIDSVAKTTTSDRSELQCDSEILDRTKTSELSEDDPQLINLSSDDLSSSINNSSALQTTLNNSGSSMSDNQNKEGSSPECAVGQSGDCRVENEEMNTDERNILNEKNQNVSGPKRKKRMTYEEAKSKAEEREKKQKEKEVRKKELEAKKVEKRLEKERKQMERDRILRERQQRKEQEEEERKERERLKQEKKEQDEREKQQRIQEKESKNKIKQMILEVKTEERKKKEEQKLKQLEERKKAEEEKKKIEMEKEQKEKERKERAKAAFVSFFVKGESHSSQPLSQVAEKEGAFLPFQVSDDMILAPVVPQAAQERFNKEQLDHFLKFQDGRELYLQNLKSGFYKDVKQWKKSANLLTCEPDVILMDKSEPACLDLRAKLLQFSDNVRPPYWGTWRKRSKKIHPRNPFGQDEIFDYTVDSDDEWDEGGPGESLSGTEDEEKESDDDYEVDNEFFVPHGYLSAEEENEDDGPASNDPEEHKALLKIKLQEFEKERKKKTTQLRPVILGCYIENDVNCKDNGLGKLLEDYAAVFFTQGPIPTTFTISVQQSVLKSNQTHSMEASSPTSDGNAVKSLERRKLVPEEAMPYLIQLLHANVNSRQMVAKEFQEFWSKHCQQNASTSADCDSKENLLSSSSVITDTNRISKRQLDMTIQRISSYVRCPNPVLKKFCWWVRDDILAKYKLADVPVPNQWNYISQKEVDEVSPAAKQNIPSIKEFLNP